MGGDTPSTTRSDDGDVSFTASDPRFLRIGKLVLPPLLLVLLHGISGLGVAEQPIILADEVGYLANARYLAGSAPLPNMQPSQFYHFGYSVLLLPAFWLFADPVSSYKAAIVINALLLSALYFPLYFILSSFLDVSRRMARFIAFTCCLYPSLVLYSSFAWSENAFIPFYAGATALFGMFLGSRSSRDALLFGFLAGFLYTIHPRALPVVAIVLAYLLVLAFLRVLPKRQALLSAATLGAVFVITRVVNGHLKAMGWAGGGEFSTTKLAVRLLPGSGFPALIERALGQVLYLSQASHGLFLVGFAAVLWLVFERARSDSPARLLASPRTGVPIFVMLTAAGVFSASCVSKLYSIHGPDGVRGADIVHGRYNEAFAVLFIAFALAECCRKPLANRKVLLAVFGVAVTTLCLTAVVAAEVRDAQWRHDPSVPEESRREEVLPSEVDAVNVPGIYPLVRLFGGLNLYAMSLASLAFFVVLAVAMRSTRRGGMALLVLLFSVFALENHRHYLGPTIKRARPVLDFVAHLDRVGPFTSISYDAAHHEPEVFFGAQFLMPRTVFHRFDSRRREVPDSEAVISGNKWRQARRLKAKFVVSSGWDNALWVLPGAIQSRLPAVSYQGVTLGAGPEFGFQEAGFYLPERFFGAPGRWTNGAAAVKVPFDPSDPPRTLAIETIVPGRDGARLRVLANRVELWNERVPSEVWSKTFDLERIPMQGELLIELESDTTSGARRLGVVVRGIRLTSRDAGNAAAYEGVTLGAEPVLGFEESGFYLPERIEGAPGRWTNGEATLRVPLDPRRPPRLLELETMAPGRKGARLRVLANDTELWNGRVPPDAWSKTFSLADVPMNDLLLLELESDTFSPAESHPDSPDTRSLGVAVRRIPPDVARELRRGDVNRPSVAGCARPRRLTFRWPASSPGRCTARRHTSRGRHR